MIKNSNFIDKASNNNLYYYNHPSLALNDSQSSQTMISTSLNLFITKNKEPSFGLKKTKIQEMHG